MCCKGRLEICLSDKHLFETSNSQHILRQKLDFMVVSGCHDRIVFTTNINAICKFTKFEIMFVLSFIPLTILSSIMKKP